MDMRKILHDSRRQLIERARNNVAELQDRSDRDRQLGYRNMYDASAITHEDDLTVGILNTRGAELQAIDTALQNIDAGRYGICADCEEAIAPARLEALPFALRCIKCQAGLERSIQRNARAGYNRLPRNSNDETDE